MIPNGAEVEQIAALERHPDRAADVRCSRATSSATAARACSSTALAAALRARPDLRGRVRARFIGSFPDAERDALRGLGLADVVEIEPTRPHDVVLQAQRDADVLLLFMQERAGAEAVVPAKTWEYLAAGRPVLALVPPHGAAAREIAAAGAGEVVAPGDADGVRRAILALADRHAAGHAGRAGAQPGCAGADIASGAGGATGRFAARAAGDDRPGDPERGRAGHGVEQPVVAGRDGREHDQRGVDTPRSARDQVPARAVAGDPEQERVGASAGSARPRTGSSASRPATSGGWPASDRGRRRSRSRASGGVAPWGRASSRARPSTSRVMIVLRTRGKNAFRRRYSQITNDHVIRRWQFW